MREEYILTNPVILILAFWSQNMLSWKLATSSLSFSMSFVFIVLFSLINQGQDFAQPSWNANFLSGFATFMKLNLIIDPPHPRKQQQKKKKIGKGTFYLIWVLLVGYCVII